MLAVIDGGLLLGIGIAATAAASYESSYVLQALEARSVSSSLALRPALLATLARRPRWLAGIALAVAGFGLQIAALTFAPLTVVQPVLALGLVLLLYLGRRLLNEVVGRRELIAVAAVIAGVAGIALAAPERSETVGSETALGVTLVLLALVAAAPYALRAERAVVLVLSAGAADVAAALAAKLAADALDRGHALPALAWAAAAGAGALVGLTSETSALQRLPATRVGPLIVVLQVTVPTLLAPLVAGEDWGATPLGGGLIAVALGVVALGAAILAGSTSEAFEHHGGGARQGRE
jgi:drug/metabolite transporter (DMT)-like permease